MVDGNGEQVPAKYVKPYDRARDRIARRIAKRWDDERSRLERVYAETMADIDELAEISGREGVRVGGAKGNLQFQSFDRLIQVGMDARYDMEFDERLRTAQALIEQFVADKSAGVDADLRELVLAAFRPTSDGLLPRARILGLLRLKIAGPTWARAMDLIKESINTRRGKTLIRVERRASTDDKFARVLLSASDVAASASKQEAVS